MTDAEFNARMDRLAERHEALTHSMELFQIGMADLRKFQEENAALGRILLETVLKHERRLGRLEGQ